MPGPEAAIPRIALRPADDGDEAFLRRVYASTRQAEMALFPGDEAQKSLFLRIQFDAQHRYYRQQFPGASFDLILRDDRPAGRLYVARTDDEFRIIDIAILPEHQGQGIGATLLHALIDEATRAGKPLRLHVERTNRARSLYLRLGFTPGDDQGVYQPMERSPA